jgi:SAM-dependent methyltransferase
MNTLFKHIPCDLCGACNPQRLGRPKVSKRMEKIIPLSDEISIVRCRNCGFYYTDPMPFWSGGDLQEIYGSGYFPEMAGWWKKTKTRVNPQRRLDIIEQYTPFKISRFLEVGCGLGYGIEEAMRRGWIAYGQEVSQLFAKQVRSRLGAEVFVGQLEEACYPEAFFDVIYVDSVVEHLPQPIKMFKQIYRILRPGGIAYITVTNEGALINEFRSLIFKLLYLKQCPVLSPLSYPIHLVGFSKDTLRMACESVGFEVKKLIVCAGANEWRKYGVRNIGSLLLNIMYYPIYLAGEIMGRGIALEALITR